MTEKVQSAEDLVPEQAEAPAGEQVAEEAEDLRRELEEERKKSAEYYDQWLRSVAELRNYKKRIEQEREQMAQEAASGLVLRLLPILDDFERALAVLPDEKLLRFSWIEGVMLIYRRLQAVLEQSGLRAIEAVGKPFDPYIHEAVLFEEVPAEQDGLVLAELQKGYRLGDRVLRPALVKVGKGGVAPTPPAGQEMPAQAEAPASEGEPQEKTESGA
ncbi:MAG: nucleotide exchange factor GrpE [Chloroflexia bacterium]